MRKIAINADYGGFCLSQEATKMLYELQNPGKQLYAYKRVYSDRSDEPDYFIKSTVEDSSVFFTEDLGDKVDDNHVDSNLFIFEWMLVDDRHDPNLIKVIETLGTRANGECADIKIVEIPDDAKYIIQEYDGCETVVTRDNVDNWNWK